MTASQQGSVVSRLGISRAIVTALLLLLISLAFALRIQALERQSMWSDEGLSYYRASLPTADVLKGLIVIDGVETRDTNPPLYFLLLHFWQNLSGESVFTLRYSGVLAGTLAVPLMFVLGSALYGRWVGLVAALLMALSPFHVWQSQVLRNYSLLVTFNLASVYGLFRYVLANPGQSKTRWLLLWLLAGLLGIYTHYFGFLVFAFGAITLTFVVARRWKVDQLLRQRLFWIVLAIGLLVMLPAIAIGLERFQAGPQIDFHQIGLVPVLIHALSAFGVGVEPSLAHPWWKLWPALLLAVMGLFLGLRARGEITTILLGYQLVPIGLMLLLSTVNPIYNGVRHLLIGLPPFLLLAAVGAVGISKEPSRSFDEGRGRLLWQGLRILLLVLVIGLQVNWLQIQFTDGALLRDDIRGVAAYLNRFADANDVIVLHDTIAGLTFDYYYDGEAEWRAIPALYEQDVARAQAALAAAGEEGERVWFVARPTPRTGFPRQALREWANSNWFRFFDREYPSMWLRVELLGYNPQPARDKMPSEAFSSDETFEGTLKLHGAAFPPTVQAGEPWWATFYWSRLDEIDEDYALSLRFIDEAGQVWAQDDGLLWHEYPPGQWPADTIIGNDREIVVPSGVPPGKYAIWMRLLDRDGQPLPAGGGAIDVYLGEINLLAGTDDGELPSFSEQFAALGDIDFLGYGLPEEKVRPGHVLPVDLFWRVRQTPTVDYRLRLELLDQAGQVIATGEGSPTREDYPTSQWQSGEVLQSKIMLNVPAIADEKSHSLRVTLISPDQNQVVAAVTLHDELQVNPWPFVDQLPADLETVNAEFGEPPVIALSGVNISSRSLQAGDALDLTFYWQAVAEVVEPYYVFIHIMAEDDTMAAQLDSAPLQGFRPTVSWRVGEVITDEYAVPLGPDLPPGAYQLWVGLYNPDSGVRPLTKVDGQATPDNRVYLGEVNVGKGE